MGNEDIPRYDNVIRFDDEGRFNDIAGGSRTAPTTKMRILLFSLTYDDGDSTVSNRALHLREQGHDVTERWIRIPRSKPGHPWPLRAFSMVPAYIKTVISAFSPSKFDSIIIPTSPPFIFAPVAARGQVTGEAVTLQHLDIFPDNAQIAGFKGPDVIFKILDTISLKAVRRAARHETLSRPMARTLEQKLGSDAAVTVTPLPPSQSLKTVPKEQNRWRSERGLDGKFLVMYAGNFGRMYDFKPILKAAEALEEHRDIAFVFVGTGFYESEIRKANQAGRGNIHIFPPEPEELVPEVLCAADLHLVPLKPGADTVMWPHKLDTLIALNQPVLAVGFDPDVAGVLPVKPDGLVDAISGCMEKKR